jgi:hypothetical protein
LIEDFKLIGQLHGISYQPLMRQILQRFADSEKKRVLRELAYEQDERKKRQEQNAVEKTVKRKVA